MVQVVLYFHFVQEIQLDQKVQLHPVVLFGLVLPVVQGILDLQVVRLIPSLQVVRAVQALHGDLVLLCVHQLQVDPVFLVFPVGPSLPDVQLDRRDLVDLLLRTGHPGLVRQRDPKTKQRCLCLYQECYVLKTNSRDKVNVFVRLILTGSPLGPAAPLGPGDPCGPACPGGP